MSTVSSDSFETYLHEQVCSPPALRRSLLNGYDTVVAVQISLYLTITGLAVEK